MINLRALAGEHYKIRLDESAKLDTERSNRVWYYQIPCKYGHVYVHGKDLLGAYTNRRLIRGKLGKLGKIHQRGDSELTIVFGVDKLDEVCECLHAYKRVKLSPEERERRADLMRELRNSREIERATSKVRRSEGETTDPTDSSHNAS